jgi:hypothetical protein
LDKSDMCAGMARGRGRAARFGRAGPDRIRAGKS